MRVFYLSDLHLRDDHGTQAARLVSFMASVPERGDLLVLGGDIFDLFVGNKRIFRERFHNVIEGIIAAARRGVGVHYLEGNHDFHFAGLFSGLTGVSVHANDFELKASGRAIWVSHGDLIDPDDRGYRFLRSITRNAFFRGFVGLLPGEFIDGIGSWSSKQSRDYNVRRDSDDAQSRVRTLYLGFARERVREGAQHVLVGHSHLRDQITIVDEGKRGEYVNLGFASECLPYAMLEPGSDAFVLRELKS